MTTRRSGLNYMVGDAKQSQPCLDEICPLGIYIMNASIRSINLQ